MVSLSCEMSSDCKVGLVSSAYREKVEALTTCGDNLCKSQIDQVGLIILIFLSSGRHSRNWKYCQVHWSVLFVHF